MIKQIGFCHMFFFADDYWYPFFIIIYIYDDKPNQVIKQWEEENESSTYICLVSRSTRCLFSSRRTLFDFTSSTSSVNDWVEISDTERDVGKSKGVLVEQKTQQFQRAVFFTLLNPQPNGAGFAGVAYRKQSFDLSSFAGLNLSVRAQGDNFIYKVILRHHHEESSLQPSYEVFFEVRRTILIKWI